jgi:predicted ArsR family transcriptional regulator
VPLDEQLATVAALADGLRRDLYAFVCRATGPVTRDEAAQALRISPKLAAFHLDKLVERGLLLAGFDVPAHAPRRVGRAPKRYRPSPLELSVSVPERRYDLVGEILVGALSRTGPGDPAAQEARRIAWDRGHGLGAEAREARRLHRPGPERTVGAAEEVLEAQGFVPSDDGDGGLILRNCPFHALAQQEPEIVCSLNQAFVDGVLRGLGNEDVRAELRPEEGLCCVRVRPG